MAKPLRSDDPNPQDRQFTHFGVLNNGAQSKSSFVTSITINVLLAICAILIGAAAKKTIDTHQKVTELTAPPPIIKPLPPPPRIKPPKLPPVPQIARVEPPKINVPEVKVPEPPKPIVKMETKAPPVITPAPPKLVTPPPAPKPVSLAQNRPAAVPNNTPHPAPVALGQANNPIAPSNRPATAAVDLGQRGLPGMPSSNSGAGPATTAVSLGSGSPGSQNMASRSAGVVGVKLGVPGGTGAPNSRGTQPGVPGVVNLGQNSPPPMPKPVAPANGPVRTGPKVIFKPKPQYTEEAVKLHIEGVVSVRLRVSSSGAVQVLGVTSDLGHGLGESAIRAVQATRFEPATDSSGHPIDWEGVVNVAFQLAS